MNVRIAPGTLSPMSENILKFKNPDRYSCSMSSYIKSHSILVININAKDRSEDQDNYYLILSGVMYFEGPLSWDDANMIVCEQSEFLAMYNRLNKYPLDAVETGAASNNQEMFVLMYRFRSSTLPVRIIVQGTIQLSTEPPSCSAAVNLEGIRLEI